MKGRWRDGAFVLGRVFGVEVDVHPSWLIVFVLVVLQLVEIPSPGTDATLTLALRVVLAVIVALLFFGSVLVHEMAHALVARRRGLTADRITLYIFGGAAKLEQESPSPRTEALVAFAGPASNLVLSFICFAVWSLAVNQPGDVFALLAGIAFWLSLSNLLLGAFNLVPGFPMDGGRVLRALAWGVTGDFVKATRVAAFVGRVFAYALIGYGFLIAVADSSNIVVGIWLAFIGWFLNMAAETSQRRVEVEHFVEGLKVRDVMERDFAVLNPHLTLDTLVDQHLLGGQTTFYPVTTDGQLIGGLDIAEVGRVPREARLTKRVSDVMTPAENLATMHETDPLWDAVMRFETTGTNGIAIVEPAEPRHMVGLVTRESVFRALRARSEAMAGRNGNSGGMARPAGEPGRSGEAGGPPDADGPMGPTAPA